MNCFKYLNNSNMGEVWSLFSGLASLSKEEILGKSRVCDYSHTTEIINSALNNYLQDDNFDLKAYEIKCSQTDDIEMGEDRKKFLSIVDNVNGKDEITVGYGQISSNDRRLAKATEEAFEFLENSDEFEKCLAQLFSVRREYIVEKGVDPVEMLKNSLKGIPEAVNSMRELALKDSIISNLILVLCENGTNVLQSRLAEMY